ncbi:MAG: histidine kinase [Oscillospiraceae bacterium]|nr:histidine kinase [Oscillospiraceae bacterium]
MKKFAEKFLNQSIKTKVQYIFIVTIVMCILLCSIFFYSLMRKQVIETVSQKNNDRLNSAEQSILSVVDSVNDMSKMIMFNDTVVDFISNRNEGNINASTVQREIYHILNLYSGSYSVFIFRNDKSYVNTGIGIIKPDEFIIFADDWYGKVSELEGGYQIISNTKGAFVYNTSLNVVSFARIINDLNTQKPLGMLVININVSKLVADYENFAEEDDGIAYLDDKGKIIYSTISKEDSKIINERKSEILSGQFSEKDGKCIISSRKVPNTDIVLVCRTPINYEAGMTTNTIASIILVFFIISAVILILNTFINKYITYPVKMLADNMKNVDGETPPCLSIETNDDEIGRLKKCYNDMIIRINKLIEEVVEQEKQRQIAEMNVIQEQIKPHFLYNTLNTIGCMAFQNTREEVYEAVETMGNFYRKFLSKGSENITIADEVDIVKSYIKLLRYRYDNLFDDQYYIQEDLKSVVILKLILQPLVENCIYHGIRPKGEKGIIKISIYSIADKIHIVIYDSGVGMGQEQIEQLLSGQDKKSFGFKGTIDRIRNFYHIKRIEDVVTIRSVEGEYCEIELIVPFPENNEVISNV